MKPGDVVDVLVDGLDDEGRGRAVVGAWDIAVRGALPGDRARARVERVFPARTLAQAGAFDLEPGSLHVARACPHPAPCPGCPLEGADPGLVLALKRERVVQALLDVGLDDVAAAVADVEAARAPRQKAKLTAGGAAGHLELGLFVPYSHDLRDAVQCPHQDPRVGRALERVRAALDELGVAPATVDKSGVKAVVARAFQEGVGVVVVTGAPLDGEHWRKLVERVELGASFAPELGARDAIAGVEGGGALDHSTQLAASDAHAPPLQPADDVAGPSWSIVSLAVRVDEERNNSIVGGAVQRFTGPQMLTPLEGGPKAPVDAFCQTDPDLAQHMYTRAADFLVDEAAGTYADLYAGAGGFSRALLAKNASVVVAVERAAASVDALATLAVETIASSVEDALPALSTRTFAGIVVDPPKSGLRDAALPLAKLGAKKVVLVACDPDAGARDCRVFVDAGYTVVAVEPLDLFPATPEVETLFLLSR